MEGEGVAEGLGRVLVDVLPLLGRLAATQPIRVIARGREGRLLLFVRRSLTRRLAAAKLSEAIDAWWTKKPVVETSAVAWPRSSDALRRDARQRKYAGRVARLLLRGHAGRQLSAGTRGLRATAALAWVAVRVSVDAAARSLWKGVRSLRRSNVQT